MAKKVIDKKQNIGNCIILATIFIITTLEWHFAEWYAIFTPYGTLITFVGLIFTAICYLDIKKTVHDPVFYMCVVTGAIAVVNVIRIGSGKGCLLVVFDMLLILYLANKVSFTKIQTYILLGYIAFFFLYWTVDVKGYFKGYNTNYGGLILITGFACLMIITESFKDIFKEKSKKIQYVIINVLDVVFIVIGYSIISWYRSRTALIGFIVLLILKYLPIKVVSNKAIYVFVTLAATVGGIIVPFLYISMANFLNSTGIQLFYKDLASGREQLWGEFFGAFANNMLTGIGSNYEVKTEWMEGMLEVHNGMLDILVIHGIIVFIPICFMMIKRIVDGRKMVLSSVTYKAVFAAVVCMLVTSFFENFIIVQPFSLILFCLLSFFNGFDNKDTGIIQ